MAKTKTKKIGDHQRQPAKANKSSKKLLSLLLVMALLLCSIPITAFAKSTAIVDYVFSPYGSSHHLHYYTDSDGDKHALFCIDHHVGASRGTYYYDYITEEFIETDSNNKITNFNLDSASGTDLTDSEWLEIYDTVFFGYYLLVGDVVEFDSKTNSALYASMTQRRVWEIVHSDEYSSNSEIQESIEDWDFSESDYDEWLEQIEQFQEEITETPSWDTKNIGSYVTGTTYDNQLIAGNTYTLTDDLLADWDELDYSSDGVTITHSAKSTKLTITIDESTHDFCLSRGYTFFSSKSEAYTYADQMLWSDLSLSGFKIHSCSHGYYGVEFYYE